MKLDYEVTVNITVIAESESEAEEMVKDFLHVPYQLSPNEIEKYEVKWATHDCEECRRANSDMQKIYQKYITGKRG